jgi:putative ABC transport system permease protein
VAIAGSDPDQIAATISALEARFNRLGLHVNNVTALSQEREEVSALFGILITLMLLMALLLALVGGLGLMGTMSINVLERTREIGVLRAIGAPNRGVAWVFIREGIAIGLLSWLLGSLLAWPLSKLMSQAVGALMTGAPLTFTYSTGGMIGWLVLVLVLSGLASFLPARSAARLTVREVLAYE